MVSFQNDSFSILTKIHDIRLTIENGHATDQVHNDQIRLTLRVADSKKGKLMTTTTIISYPDLTLFYTWPWETWVRDYVDDDDDDDGIELIPSTLRVIRWFLRGRNITT